MHLETEIMEKILVDLGYNLQDKGRYWQSNAVYREGDNKSALIIWKDTGMWKDFVAATRYSSFKKLVTLSGAKSPEKVDEYIKKIDSGAEWYFDRPKVHKMEFQEIFSHEEVDSLMPHYSFYNKKGISDDILKIYKSGLSMSGKMNSRFVFPIFSESGKIIGLSGRHLTWNSNSNIPKWKHLGKKANFVYPAFMPTDSTSPFIEALEARQELLIVEGIGDSLALSQMGYFNHLVLFGLTISSKQLSFISSQPLKKIYIATNNEKSNRGIIAAVKIFLKLMSFVDISKLEIRLPVRKKDFCEMLESNIPMSEWENKKVNMVQQIDYILAIKKEDIELDSKQRKLLMSYKEQLTN